jgi:hypothetical protein
MLRAGRDGGNFSSDDRRQQSQRAFGLGQPASTPQAPQPGYAAMSSYSGGSEQDSGRDCGADGGGGRCDGGRWRRRLTPSSRGAGPLLLFSRTQALGCDRDRALRRHPINSMCPFCAGHQDSVAPTRLEAAFRVPGP